MKAQELIIQGIDALSIMFPHMSFKYGFDNVVNQHIIDVQPESEYQTDAYAEVESDFILNFIREFPDEGILFVCNNPYVQLPGTIYIKCASINTKLEDVTIGMISQKSQFGGLLSAATIFNPVKSGANIIEKGRMAVTISNTSTISDKDAGEYSYAMAA